MGVVYEATQISLGRQVALKVLPFAPVLSDKPLQRFQNEAQAAAHLNHPNIVPVYAVGCERGVHYYAMQYIEGRTLAAVIAELRRLDRAGEARPSAEPKDELRLHPGRRARLGPARARPDGRARTVRRPRRTRRRPPGSSGRTAPPTPTRGQARPSDRPAPPRSSARRPASGSRRPRRSTTPTSRGSCTATSSRRTSWSTPHGNLWVTDFGLARIQGDAGLTMTGDLLGTLRYMSPEQALAKRVVVDHRTDIYSLGVTLYELLTLRPGVRRGETARRSCGGSPSRSRRRRGGTTRRSRSTSRRSSSRRWPRTRRAATPRPATWPTT